MGASGTRHSPRPLEGERILYNSGALRGENAKLRPLRLAHSSLRAKRSNPSRRVKKEWIASVASLLAMTVSDQTTAILLAHHSFAPDTTWRARRRCAFAHPADCHTGYPLTRRSSMVPPDSASGRLG